MHYRLVMIQLVHDFTHLTSQCPFLCSTCLDSEPLHFASKSVEILHASLYHWSLMNKPALDLPRFGWENLCGRYHWL